MVNFRTQAIKISQWFDLTKPSRKLKHLDSECPIFPTNGRPHKSTHREQCQPESCQPAE